jgi:hypothetical protein
MSVGIISQKSNKILPATSACCGSVVKNECKNHFSINKQHNSHDLSKKASNSPFSLIGKI